jgi:6-phosphogluconolactonase
MTTTTTIAEPKQRDFANASALADALVAEVAARLRAGIAGRGRASLLVSGGTTPKRFFRALSTADLDWKKVTIAPVDERWVPPDSDRSNSRLIMENLLTNDAASARFLAPYLHGKTAGEGAAGFAARSSVLARPFDVVILGMGNDGHTASFFPGGNNLRRALDLKSAPSAVAIDAPGAEEPRVTFTLRELLDTGFLALHIEGEAKAATLARALQPGPVEDMPIRAVLRQARTPLTIYWCP